MEVLLQAYGHPVGGKVKISGSKSETNRLLLLRALYPQISLQNLSDADDTQVMVKALEQFFSDNPQPTNTDNRQPPTDNQFPDNRQPTTNNLQIDIHHAGTAMRFLTAYLAMQEGKTAILTGSSRMKERPIRILVDALHQLGAAITYEEKEGFPPLKITGKKLLQNKVTMNAAVSSQYISALLLIAPQLQNGLELTLEGEITSRPYIEMTLKLLEKIGISTSFAGNTIRIGCQNQVPPQSITIEPDWSSASYFYSIVALSNDGTTLDLPAFRKDSLQGDSSLAVLYRSFGVETLFAADGIVLRKSGVNHSPLEIDLNATPDLAQTIAVTCFGLGMECHLTGLHTLKIKETDRLAALKAELTKLGADVAITDDSLRIAASKKINPSVKIATYTDHRMAMAFAPLALKVPIVIEDAEVVSKSYPAFWEDLKWIGFKVEPL